MGIRAWSAALHWVGRANAVSVLPSDLLETFHGVLSVALSRRLWLNKDLQHGLEPITFRTQKNEFPRVESSGLLWKQVVSRLQIRIRGFMLQPGQWDLRKQDIMVLLLARALAYGTGWVGEGRLSALPLSCHHTVHTQ